MGGGGESSEGEEEGRPHNNISGREGEIQIPPWKGTCQIEEIRLKALD